MGEVALSDGDAISPRKAGGSSPIRKLNPIVCRLSFGKAGSQYPDACTLNLSSCIPCQVDPEH